MSPNKFKKLEKLRKKLDKLDNLFIRLIKKRTGLVDKVLSLKEYKNQIVDKKRTRFEQYFDLQWCIESPP